jgi:threonine dehydrogenase-like Zn-dependent dehydrogenase
MAVAFGILDRARFRIGDSLTILGDGSVGLHTLIVAKAAGARRVVLSGHHAPRLALAAALGARIVDRGVEEVEDVVRAMHGQSDVVVDATGSTEAFAQATRLVRPEGRIVLGGSAHGKFATVPEDTILRRNLRIAGAGHNPGWMSRALACVTDGVVSSEVMISHQYPLAAYEAALAQCETRSTDLVKSMFAWASGVE